MSLYTKKHLTEIVGSREKEETTMYESGGTGSPLLGINVWFRYDWI
jgi:hypothetical protein